MNNFNQAVVTLGGKGTRLSEITNGIPKPLWPILGLSTLERCIKNLVKYKFLNFIFLVGFKEDLFIKEIERLSKKYMFKYHIHKENSPKGEAGALIDIINRLDEKFLFINGDIIFNIDLKRLIKFDYFKKSELTFVTHTSSHPEDSDCIIESPSLNISEYKFKNKKVKKKGFFLGNAGLSLVSRKIIECISKKIKSNKEELSFFKDFIILSHLNKFKVFSYNTSEYICDMGTPKRLKKVEFDIRSGIVEKLSYANKQSALFIDKDNTLIRCQKNEYILNFNQISFYKERLKKFAKISKNFDLVIIVSNQPQISMGLVKWQKVINMNGEIIKECISNNLIISSFYICPHHPHKGFAGENKFLKINCFCRKPNPGLFLEAAYSRNINLSKSLMIGDSDIDKEAAINASVPFKWVQSL